MTVHPRFDSYPIYEEMRNPYLDALYKDEGEEEILGWGYGDAVADEVFEESQQYAEVPQELDDIEGITLQIFTALYSIADRKERKDIEDVIAYPTPYEPESISETHETKSSRSHQFRPFQKDSNFYSDDFDPSLHSPNLMQRIVSILADLFLGIELAEQKHQTQEEMDDMLKKNYMIWQYSLKEHYTTYFQDKIQAAFREAEELVARRGFDEKIAYLQRITFYATLIITMIGKLVDHRRLAMFGTIASSITFLFMIVHYGTTSFREAQEAVSLKCNVDLIYYEASEYRTNV